MMILDKVREAIKKYRLIVKNDRIVVGVSGGPDSVVLLYILNALKKELRFSIHIAYLDHMLRTDSYKDKAFVEGLAKRLKIPITCAQINVKELAKKGSLEEIARNARLGFLFKVAKDIKAKKIALGHNLDDQAETVLMRILRGAGLSGLTGILPKREIADFQIIRPLIEVRRREIEAFLKKKKIKPCLDTSNLEDIYFRNRIRNRLLPLLEREYNQNIKGVLSNMAESVGCDYDCLNRLTYKAMKRMGAKINGSTLPIRLTSFAQGSVLKRSRRTLTINAQASRSINLKKFLKLHPAIQRMVLRLAITRVKGDTRRITFQHIKELEDLILNRPVNSVVDLPKGVSVIREKKYLSFYRRN